MELTVDRAGPGHNYTTFPSLALGFSSAQGAAFPHSTWNMLTLYWYVCCGTFFWGKQSEEGKSSYEVCFSLWGVCCIPRLSRYTLNLKASKRAESLKLFYKRWALKERDLHLTEYVYTNSDFSSVYGIPGFKTGRVNWYREYIFYWNEIFCAFLHQYEYSRQLYRFLNDAPVWY